MASSSSSSRNWAYHVFPSFSGEDVRKNFLSHFLKELDRELIIAFKDNEIEKSQSIWPELVQAIRDSRIAVVVFSKSYASSSWCLNELLEILKCKEEFGQMVIPVFYGVDPSDVRKQTGDFGKVFDKTCKNVTKEVKNRWQKGLSDVANIVGYHSQNWVDEAKMIETIVNDVFSKLSFTPSKDFEDMPGLEDHITKMKLLLKLESKEAKMVGIWGPSGIGKTTIARALFSELSGQFQGSVFIGGPFVEVIKAKYSEYNTDEHGLKLQFQEAFLSKLLNRESVAVDHLGAVSERLNHRKFLIFIDDLDDQVVLDALVRETQCFGSGSRIVVNTKDKQLLTSNKIDDIYEVGLPSEELALEMLCRSAFKQSNPPEGFQELAVEVARISGNLPISLAVLGSSLRGEDKKGWMDMMPRLQNGLDGKIDGVLRVGYDRLSNQDKAIFRHIACLFNFEKVNDIRLLLAHSRLDFDTGLRNLVDKSLVRVRLGIVEMHTLLQKMGKEIVRDQSKNPGKREFLMDSADVRDVLEENIGTQNILGISLNIDEIDDEFVIHESAFEKMRNLQFLKIFTSNYSLEKEGRLHLPDSFDYLPPKLRLLCWHGYPMKSMPSKFRPDNLVKLKMQNSKLKKLWEGPRKLRYLKEMNLWGSENLKEIPDLSMATSLEKIYVAYRLSWVQLPSHIQKFNHLTKILECNNLATRPTGINLESPKRLNLLERSRLCLENVADFCMENLQIEKLWGGMQLISMGTTLPTSLTVLFLSDIPNMVELPFSIHNLNKLTDLRITRCINLEILPTGINLESLERLNFSGCSRLKTFPDISRNISSLYLEETAIEEVPWWTENFTKLKYLIMQRCSELEYVYINLSKLKHLELVDFSHCGALTGADWNGGFTSGMALEREITDTELQLSNEASSSRPYYHVPKVHFSFVNCFNLDREALLQQLSFEKLILSGEKLPLYFTHRTNGNSLAISLLQTAIPPFLRFRAGAVFAINSLSEFGVNGVWINVECRFKGRLGNRLGSSYQKEYFSVNQIGSHLFIFDCRIPLKFQNDLPSEVDVRFRFSCDAFCKMKGWGIRLFEKCSSSENRLGDPNTLARLCEANVVDETEQGEECRDREKQ